MQWESVSHGSLQSAHIAAAPSRGHFLTVKTAPSQPTVHARPEAAVGLLAVTSASTMLATCAPTAQDEAP